MLKKVISCYCQDGLQREQCNVHSLYENLNFTLKNSSSIYYSIFNSQYIREKEREISLCKSHIPELERIL